MLGHISLIMMLEVNVFNLFLVRLLLLKSYRDGRVMRPDLVQGTLHHVLNEELPVTQLANSASFDHLPATFGQLNTASIFRDEFSTLSETVLAVRHAAEVTM